MTGESVNFDFTSRGADQLAGDFRKTGDSAALAARGARLLADSLERQRKASDVSAGSTLALAKADKILADAEHTLADGALEAEFALKKEADAAKKAGEDSAAAGAGMGALAGGGGIPGGGMGAAIAAGVALAPVLVTVGAGLGGLGLAAYGVIKPIENAAQKTGGLAANMKLLNPEQRAAAQSLIGLQGAYHGFENALQPVLLKDFATAAGLAANVLHDLEPVSKATGVALGGFLHQVDAEFASGAWQNFFGFMGRTAGPDMKLLGNNLLPLLDLLPRLLTDLQPLATTLLADSAGVLRLADDSIILYDRLQTLNKGIDTAGAKAQHSGGVIGFLGHAAAQAAGQMVPGVSAARALGTQLGRVGDSAKTAGPKTDALGGSVYTTSLNAATAGAKLQSMAQAVLALNTAESKSLDTQLAYSGDLIANANNAVAFRVALKASAGQIGLHTQKERDSFTAANTYISGLEATAKQSWASGAGTKGAADAIRKALPLLGSAATGNRNYWQEVRTLKQWLDKLAAEKPIRDVVKLTGSGSWTFGLSGTGSFPSRPIKGHAAGTAGAAPGWALVGERGPELMKFRGGEVVIPNHAIGALGYAAGTPSYAGALAGLKPWGQSDWNASILAMTQAFAAAGKQLQASAAASYPGGGSSGPGALAAQKYAASILGLYGWGQSQMASLIPLWNQESGWRWNALNASSGAYGIPQSLPASKMAAAGADWRTNPATQIRWGLGYIRGRYGSPAGAEAHEQAFNWYGNGLDAIFRKKTLIGVGDRPEHVRVTPLSRGGGDHKIVLEFRAGAGSTALEQALVEIIQKFVSANGGDVAVALGEK